LKYPHSPHFAPFGTKVSRFLECEKDSFSHIKYPSIKIIFSDNFPQDVEKLNFFAETSSSGWTLLAAGGAIFQDDGTRNPNANCH
jgi:hypothetical protein